MLRWPGRRPPGRDARVLIIYSGMASLPIASSRVLMTEAFPNRPTSLADYLEILHRRIWIILIPVVLAPILTYVIANREKPVYSASANVYINLTPALSQALGFFSQTAGDPKRYFQTEATIARKSEPPSLGREVAARLCRGARLQLRHAERCRQPPHL